MATIWSNIQTKLGITVTEEQQSNADSIYNLICYGSSTGTDGWIPGADVPFIGADGFCSPVGSGWVSRVTSEFGYRSDPFTGQTKGTTRINHVSIILSPSKRNSRQSRTPLSVRLNIFVWSWNNRRSVPPARSRRKSQEKMNQPHHRKRRIPFNSNISHSQ